MGIVNRSLDSSEQQRDFSILIPGTATGTNYMVMRAPHAMELQNVEAAVLGLSGAPTAQLKVQRFVAGAGLTTFAIGGRS